MVQSNVEGDGIERHVQYASFRTDKAADPGFSPDLISNSVDPSCFDDFNKLPVLQTELNSILDLFLNQVKARPNHPFLGTRIKNVDGTFGAYDWQTYSEVHTRYEEISKGSLALNLYEPVEGINEDGKDWSFCGIWSKNRWEWHTTMLSAMVCKATIIGFYDSMGDKAVDYCLKQTKMKTIFISKEYLTKLLDMRNQGMATEIQNIIIFENESDESLDALIKQAEQSSIRVLTLDAVREAGRNATDLSLHPEEVTRDTVYMLNYTSGTTGDSKGVKVSHWAILNTAIVCNGLFVMNEDDVIIDYLPAPHVFDQYMFVMCMFAGARQGYYQGSPLKLMEDCAILQPTIFPSVPRLYNKIYAKIKAGLDAATGCKGWLVNRALASKNHYLTQTPTASYTSGCYDSLVFKKIGKILGGRVRMMITASAPISKEVLEMMKICFSCPVFEAYGLSETCGAVTVSLPDDPISGTIGGPVASCAIRLKDLPEMEYRITDKPFPRGEICIRGPCITKGYFMRPDLTQDAIDSQGYLQTGDVGMIYPNGTIKILDRSKNIFKLSQGEYVAPEKCENIFIQSNFIAQCMVYGDSFKNCCVAIIVPEPEALNKWATENGKTVADVVGSQDSDFAKVLLDEIDVLGKAKKLNSLEKPKEVFIASEAFSVDNDILTPTFKLKRNICKKVYQAQIDEMYAKLEARGL